VEVFLLLVSSGSVMGIFSLCFRYGGRPFSFLLLSAVPQGYPSHSFLFPLPRSFNVSPFLCLSF